MNKIFKSYTIVPEEFYVERSADCQLRQIIDDMERPGYVLVARQMGKTNLLMHAKRLNENSKVIFAYFDFSTLVDLDEENFFKNIIDTTIETHEECFAKAIKLIEESRKIQQKYTTRQYTKELRILSKFVDKIVFIMDEIDALTKVEYSDKVFSQIRSDYFQRTNYHELEKVTYILSGVIEPKDIIKNPNISPFNIGQKIYLSDFNKEEYKDFIEKTKISFTEDVIERLYFWTHGNPRMTWDLCVEINNKGISEAKELDSLVESYYFESYDKAPIDSVRDLVKRDTFVRDAIIQIHYGITSTMDATLKQKLYLAGIVEYNGKEEVFIKNPILKEALSLEWLMQMQTSDNNHLDKAYKLIHLDRSYNEAISLLNKYIILENIPIENRYRAYLYLGECYFRIYNIEESQMCLAKIDSKADFEILEQAYLLQGYNFTNSEMFDKAIKYFDYILENKNSNDHIVYKAKIGKAEALVKTGDDDNLNKAQHILSHFINCKEDDFKMQYLAQCYAILSLIESTMNNQTKAIEFIDYAIRAAQDKERPILYYRKLKLLEEIEGDVNTTIYEMLASLKKFKSRPDIEDFDNTLGLNIVYVALILSEIILKREAHIDEIAPFLRWLNESKEAAYNSICKILCGISDVAIDFANHIIKLSKNAEWNFGEDHLFNAWAAIYLRTKNNNDAINFYKYISSIKFDQSIYTFIPNQIMCEMLINLVQYYLFINRSPRTARDVLAFYRKHYSENIDENCKLFYVYSLYYEFVLSILLKSFKDLNETGPLFIIEAENNLNKFNEKEKIQITKMVNEVRKTMESVADHLKSGGLIENNHSQIGRNTKVIVRYFHNNKLVTDKYKKLRSDIDSRLCQIIQIID